MNTQIDRLGKVSITVEKDYWNINKCYDKLVVVEKENDGGYLSRKPVPVGISIYNREYWIKIGGSSSSSGVILDAIFNPSSINVGVLTNITINVQVSSPATEIKVIRGSTQVGSTGNGTQHTVIDTVTPENTNSIFYQITALVNNSEIGKGFEVHVNSASAPIEWSTNSITYYMNDNNPILPTLRNEEGLSIEYESTNSNVITINSQSGEIQLIGAGSAIIKAIFRGNQQYQETVVELNVVVRKAVFSDLSWRKNNQIITIDNTTIGEEYNQPYIYPSDAVVTYSTSNSNVATINNTGIITIVGSGSCNIIANFAGNDIYEAKEVLFKLNVTEQRFNVFVGAGSDYNNTTFVDTGNVLSNNMIVNISTNDGDYIFIKVGKNETINNFATYVSAGSPFNYIVALDNPVDIDENYKYYKSTNRFRVSTGNYIINKTN